MIIFDARYLDGKTSKVYNVTLSCDGKSVYINGEKEWTEIVFPLSECRLTPALGKTARALLLPGGARCEFDESEAIKKLEELKGGSPLHGVIHLIEERWHLAIGCMVGLVAFVFFFAAYGIPTIANVVARKIPVDIMGDLSDSTLTILDKHLFQPSELDTERQLALSEELVSLKEEIGSGLTYHLEFRNSPQMGANAIALPSGTIVMTDQLVEISENDKELIGILLHEMGHVENRHGLRMALQNTGVFFLISALAGDIVSVTSLAGTLPTMLVESGYSRKFEQEADEFFADFSIKNGRSTKPFQDILARITKDKELGITFLSTHPATRERIEYIEALEEKILSGQGAEH